MTISRSQKSFHKELTMNKKLKWHFSQLAIFYFDSNKLKTTRTTLRIVNNSFFSKCFPHGILSLKGGNWSNSLDFFFNFLLVNTKWTKFNLGSVSYVIIAKNISPGCFRARNKCYNFWSYFNFVRFKGKHMIDLAYTFTGHKETIKFMFRQKT